MVVIEKIIDQTIDSEGMVGDIPFGADMFKDATFKGNSLCVHNKRVYYLCHKITSYVHSYVYSGGIDTSLLDRYDLIFLHEMNEYSVEIVRRIIPIWSGRRLVMVSEAWEDMLPFLPDIEGVECFFYPSLSEADRRILSEGFHPLHVMEGSSHAEGLERLRFPLFLYDEVMALSFMFSNLRHQGDLNPGKNFFVLDGFYGNLGLFAFFEAAKAVLCYAVAKGYTPVAHVTRAGGIYSDYQGDEIWTKFFADPGGISFEEVSKSQNVTYSPGFYNGTVMNEIMKRLAKEANEGSTERSTGCRFDPESPLINILKPLGSVSRHLPSRLRFLPPSSQPFLPQDPSRRAYARQEPLPSSRL